MDHLRPGSKSKLYSVSAPPAYGWLAGDTSSIAFDPPTDSPAFPDTRGTTSGGATDLRNWRRTFGAVEAAARAVKEHSDVAIPLTAVVGAMSALVEYHDTSDNAENVKEIERRVQSLSGALASPVDEGDYAEKWRRVVLRRKLEGVVAELEPLSKKYALFNSFSDVDKARALAGFIQELTSAITDYQVSIKQGVYKGMGIIHDENENILRTPQIDDPRVSLQEIAPLIETTFTSQDEAKTINDLHGDDAQAFIDTIHKALDLPDLPPQLRRQCLNVLCRVCGRLALLPRSLQLPLCYNPQHTPLYRGGYADVWKGKCQDRPVAVKILRVYSTSDFEKIIRRFCKEVVTWRTLRHPNVLPLLGVTMGNNHFAMVSEWMANGNINEFVDAHRGANRFELLKDVIQGLIYMHSQAMIHGDLKGANILIDQNGRACLADFGLLTIASDPANPTTSNSIVIGGTIRWMSPELLDPDQFGFGDGRPTKESDCYALGMVIYEVLSGQAPFTSLKNYIVIRKVIEGERPGRPEGAEGAWFTDNLWVVLNLCWETQPESRPSVETVLECVTCHVRSPHSGVPA